jgi:hypothetical protein
MCLNETYSKVRIGKHLSDSRLAYYAMGTEGFSLGVKQLRRKAHLSPTTSDKIKNTFIYICTPPYAFMAQCLIS